MKYQYQTSGTCSRLIEIEVEDGLIKDVCFTGGCHGNLQGIGVLKGYVAAPNPHHALISYP